MYLSRPALDDPGAPTPEYDVRREAEMLKPGGGELLEFFGEQTVNRFTFYRRVNYATHR